MSSNSKTDILVIGAGQMRTGTRSLKSALDRLLDKPCYHMTEVFANPNHTNTWLKALEQDRFTQTEAEEILKNYAAIVDYPGCIFYEDLMQLYPNAKVILSVRDARKWRTSCLNTVCKKESFLSILLRRFSDPPGFIKLKKMMLDRVFGHDFDMNDEEKAIEKFEEWNQKVITNVPEDRLLVFEASHGWAPLCSFLEKPIPDEEYPFENTTQKFQKYSSDRKRKFLQKKFIISSTFICAIIVSGIFIYKKISK